MTIGTKVRFSYKDRLGSLTSQTLTLSGDYLPKAVISDEEIVARLSPNLQKYSLDVLLQKGYIFAARHLLHLVPDATDIFPSEQREQQQNPNNKGEGIILLILLAVLAVVLAVVCLPLFVILGMHNKLFLKEFYNKYESEDYKKFTKNYTYIGIALYAFVVLLALIALIFHIGFLTTLPFPILFFGAIAYFVVSLLLIKKNFAPEGEKINFIATLKAGFNFKKKKKSDKTEESTEETAETEEETAA